MHYDHRGLVHADDGTPLFYGILGTGSDVILCDGIGCDGYAWEYLQPQLAQHHRVIHWHYRGHGRSGKPRDPARIDVPALARDLEALCRALPIERALMVGHSMGVQVLLEHQRIAPERATGFVFLCGSSGKITQTFHGSSLLHELLPSIVEVVQHRRRTARALLGWIPPRLAFVFAALGKEINAKAIKREDFVRYWQHMTRMDPKLFLDMLRAAGEHDAKDMLASLRVPTMVVAAENDTFTPATLAAEMADAIPGASLHILRGASHAGPVEQPAQLKRLFDQFLAAHFPKANEGTASRS